jgi:hypothetical protein
MLQPHQVFLRFDRGRATGPGSGDGLPVNPVSHIARDENARMLALGEMPND